jgi:hypothetical protein
MADNECCGDYMVAVYLNDTVGHSMNFQLSGNKFQGEPIHNVAFNDRNWCQEIITLHSQSARDFELMWEYLKIKGNDIILHRDLYLDFIKPYLPSEPKPKWDNQAKEIEYSWLIDNGNDFKKLNNNNNIHANKNKKISSIEYEDKPYASLENCINKCKAIENCLMIRYDPYKLYCGISSSLTLGRPIMHYKDDNAFHSMRSYLNKPLNRVENDHEADDVHVVC